MAKQQDRVELKGSARTAMPGGQDVGPADPNQADGSDCFFAARIEAGRISVG